MSELERTRSAVNIGVFNGQCPIMNVHIVSGAKIRSSMTGHGSMQMQGMSTAFKPNANAN